MPRYGAGTVGSGGGSARLMTRRATPRLSVYSLIAVLGLIGGLALGRPELVAVAAAPILALGLGYLRLTAVFPTVEIAAGQEQAVEGDVVELQLTVRSDRSIPHLDVTVELPVGLRLEGVVDEGGSLLAERPSFEVAVPGEMPLTVRLVVRCLRWGNYRRLRVVIEATDFLGLFEYTATTHHVVPLKVFPEEKLLSELLQPVSTQLYAGELLSRRRGDGLEFAELRPFVHGDDRRRINWRASSRRGQMWVNERHPDRNSDVVLLVDGLDAHADVEVQDLAVTAAASLASGHLGRRDRVGLIVLGGRLVWIRPRMVSSQRYAMLEALTESRTLQPQGIKLVAKVPYRALPPQALIIALSPLREPSAIAALAELRGRGYDLAIVEIMSDVATALPGGRSAQLARRIWQLERDRIHRSFIRNGVAVARWDPAEPFDYALGEVASLRRAMIRSAG